MMQRALSTLTRRRFPGTGDEVSRWTVRLSSIPAGADAVVLLSVEELAVNDLRETFHHWVRTVAFEVRRGELGATLAHRPAVTMREALPTHDERHVARARDVVEDVTPALQRFLSTHAERLTQLLRDELQAAGVTARKAEDERYRSRQGEVSTLISENTLNKLEREVTQLRHEQQQGFLFDEGARLAALERSIEEKQLEIERRRRHHDEVRQQLERERNRILNQLLPKRHAMAGAAQVFPVTIEVRLPLPGGVA
jgi:hypothetical protein